MIDILDSELQSERGISLRWYDVLAHLEDADDGLRMSEVANRILSSKSGLTRVIDRMEDAGLVRRERPPDDRRVINIFITPAGLRDAGGRPRGAPAWHPGALPRAAQRERHRRALEIAGEGARLRPPAAPRPRQRLRPPGSRVREMARVAQLESGESPERGREARVTIPRSVHGEWTPTPDRPDPVAVLQAQAATRVQELVPIRYGRMLVSPFTFYRGAAAVMAADLAATPDSGIVVQACGDAHISNFGAFAVPDRRLVFGPNDFDETLPGPWEWDVKRMAASAEIAGRDVGLPADRRQRVVTRACASTARACGGSRARAISTSGTTVSTRASWSSASAGSWARRGGSCSRSRSPRRGARRACARSRS